MNTKREKNFSILDCTFRDGGYLNQWRFDKNLVRQAYRALSNSGIEFIELGYRQEQKRGSDGSGIWRYTPEEQINQVVADIEGAAISLMADFRTASVDDFCPAVESAVKLVRLSMHKNDFLPALRLLEAIKKKGYAVSLNAMGYTNYSAHERANLARALKGAAIDYIYIVDSYGSLFPHQVKGLIEPLLLIGGIKVGFHPHNSLQMAFANTLEAIRCGVDMIDSTIYGMGRAAGNLPTEIIVAYLEREGRAKYNSIPVLNIIDRFFVKLQEENKWGYQLPYMLSGMFGCHPDYALKMVEEREYTIGDIWKALDYVRSQDPVGFNKELLDGFIHKGFIGPVTGNTCRLAKSAVGAASALEVPYLNRHKGRDFLILANGPSLKQCKPEIERFIKKYDPVVVGANFLGGFFTPQYHAFTNKRRFGDYIDSVDPASILLISQHIPETMVREFTNREYEQMYYVDTLDADFGIHKGLISTNCRTVAVLLLGVAVAMGARRLFAAGMDGYARACRARGFHFYHEQDEKEDEALILERHSQCQKFIGQIDAYMLKRGKEGVHILTPTSYRAFYKGIKNYV